MIESDVKMQIGSNLNKADSMLNVLKNEFTKSEMDE